MDDSQPEVGMVDYLAALRRRRVLIAMVSVPILAAAGVLAAGLPDQFVSTAVIAFKDAAVSGSLPTDKATAISSYQDLYVRGLANAVLSPDVLRQLLRQMPQLTHPRQTWADAVREIADRTSVAPVRTSVLDPSSGRERLIVPTFTVAFADPDPETAQRVATWLSNAFVGGNRAGLGARARFATEFYGGEAERSRARMALLERRLAQFKASHSGELPELTKLNISVLDQIQRDLADVSEQLAELDTNRDFLQRQLVAARAGGADAPLVAQLQAQYNSKLSVYGANHPDMVELRLQIAALRAADQPVGDGRAKGPEADSQSGTVGEAQSIQLRNRVKVLVERSSGLRQRQRELLERRAAIQERLAQTPETEREYAGLQRDLDLMRAQFTELSNREGTLKLTDAAIATGRSDELRVSRPAGLPSKAAHPRRLIIMVIGVALACMAALAAVVAAEVLDGTVRGRRDIRVILSVAPLAIIPEIAVRHSFDRSLAWRIAAASAGVLTACLVLLSFARNFYWC